MRQALGRAGQYLFGFIGFALIIVFPLWQGLDGRHGGWGEFVMWCLYILFAYKIGKSNGAADAKKKHQCESGQRESGQKRQRLAERKRREFELPL